MRRACHAWHVGQAGGGACGEHATRGTFARQEAERAASMPRVARRLGRERSVRRACHAWHVKVCATRGLQGATRELQVPRVGCR